VNSLALGGGTGTFASFASEVRGQRARVAFDRETYRRRNVVERGINRLKQSHTIATRYAKRAANYRAMVVIASILIWIGP
jgi:transposase